MTTSRRDFVAGLAAAGVGLPRLAVASPQRAVPSPAIARPSPAQLAWQDLELGMFIHFAPNTWQDQEYDDRSTPLDTIRPDIDTDQWVETAVGMGARYIVMVAKHVGGFCWWQTDTTAYSVRNIPWRNGTGDVMADLARSCAARGVQLGVYLSPRDDSFGAGGAGRCATPEAQAAYDRLYRQQLTELLTQYGPIMELWLDGSSVVPTIDIVSRFAPDAMIFQGPDATIRWVGNEDGFAPYPCWNALASVDADTGVATAMHGDANGDRWMPVEVDVSLRRPNWFWSTTNHANLLSLDELIEIYYRSVGRGAQLLLNVAPDRSGCVPDADVRRLAAFGDAIRCRFGWPVAETEGARRVFTLALGGPRRVEHVLLEERLDSGEQVRGWLLEGFDGTGWIPLGGGSAIGRKHIQPVGPVTVVELRLSVSQAVGEPWIRRFAAFDASAAPPATWADPVYLWADDIVGDWSPGEYEIDLSAHIESAGTYRVRFASQAAGPIRAERSELLVAGVPIPGHVRQESGRRDVLLVRITDPTLPVTIRAVLHGGGGQVLMRQS
jgi:alpha-L-fucosidase